MYEIASLHSFTLGKTCLAFYGYPFKPKIKGGDYIVIENL